MSIDTFSSIPNFFGYKRLRSVNVVNHFAHVGIKFFQDK